MVKWFDITMKLTSRQQKVLGRQVTVFLPFYMILFRIYFWIFPSKVLYWIKIIHIKYIYESYLHLLGSKGNLLRDISYILYSRKTNFVQWKCVVSSSVIVNNRPWKIVSCRKEHMGVFNWLLYVLIIGGKRGVHIALHNEIFSKDLNIWWYE